MLNGEDCNSKFIVTAQLWSGRISWDRSVRCGVDRRCQADSKGLGKDYRPVGRKERQARVRRGLRLQYML